MTSDEPPSARWERKRLAGFVAVVMPRECASAVAPSQAWRRKSTASAMGQGPPALPGRSENHWPVEELHHHVRQAVLQRADVEWGRDVLAVDEDCAARASPTEDAGWRLTRWAA